MNSTVRRIVYAGAGLLSLALIGTVAAPKVAAAVKAAFVEVVIPSNPFFGRMQLSGYGAQSVGPGTGTLGVNQIVLTNFDSVVNQVNIFSALLNGGTCGGTNNVPAATDPFLIVKVQPNSTLVIPAPTPLVFTPQTGYDNVAHTCVGASMPITGGNVFVTVSGFIN